MKFEGLITMALSALCRSINVVAGGREETNGRVD